MNILIDTNVVIDVLAQRELFFEQSQLVLLASEEKIINGYISATAITDIFYITNKIIKSKKNAKELLKKLIVDTVKVAMVDETMILQALDAGWDDFEDCVQNYVGESISADYIVTRNPNDYSEAVIPVLTPEEFLDIIAPE